MLLERFMTPVLLLGPMLQMPSPDRVVLVWEADAATHGAKVIVTTIEPGAAPREIDARHVGGTRFEADLSNLEPGLEYRVAIRHRSLVLGDQIVEISGIHAPAARGASFRFLAFGDSGNGSNTQTELAALLASKEPDVVIHAGDLVYLAGARRDYPFKFYEPNELLLRRAFFMPSLGNHDCATLQGRPMLDEFVLPENGPPGVPPERYYWFDYGDARFVALDSNISGDKYGGVLTPEQMAERVAPWLRRVLTDCDARWKFVYYHHPIYTGCLNHPIEEHPWMREVFLPVIEETGVDMVFAGHNHLYERSAPMRGGEMVANGAGTVHITTGAGGVNRYPQADEPPAYIVAHNDQVFSFTLVSVGTNRLVLQQIDEDDRVIDEYVIEKPPARH